MMGVNGTMTMEMTMDDPVGQDGRASRGGDGGGRDLASIHRPVLLDECVGLVAPALDHSGATVVDCTLGLAGHSLAFLKAAPQARLVGIDRDAEALGLAARRIADEGLDDRFTPVHAPFDQFTRALDDQGIGTVDAVFMDLGLSSLQIDESERGFAYSKDAPLDMRMDPGQDLTAAMVLNTYPMEDLRRIMREYGEERFAQPIARAIVRVREREPFSDSARLVDLVDRTIPRAHRAAGNPAKRVFQALRIEVNGELDKLSATLPQAALRLNVGGRIVVESYHSLEDTITKRFFASGLVSEAPAGLPVVPDDMLPFFRDLTHGAVKADERERETNPRSASVRLRAVELVRPIPERVRRRYGRAADPSGGRHDEHGRHRMGRQGRTRS